MKEKLICTNCNNIIEFDKEKSKDGIVFCNHCTTKYNYADCKKVTNQIFSSHLQRGQGFMMQQGKYPEAKEEFKECLKIKENDMSALTGYIVSSIYCSNFENINFLLIKEEIEKRDIVLNQENTFILLCMIKDLMVGFNEFIKSSQKNLIIENIFVNEKLFNLYIKGLNDGLEVLKYFNDSFSLMHEEEYNDYLTTNQDFKNNFDKLLDEYKSKLNSNYNVNKIGDIQVQDGKITILESNKKEILEPEYIEMGIIPVNEKAKMYQLVMLISFGGLAICALGLMIAYWVSKKPLLLYSELVVIGAGAALFFIFKKLFKNSY